MAQNSRTFRNLVLPLLIFLFGLSVYEYNNQGEVTWYRDPFSALQNLSERLRSLLYQPETKQAPLVVERSEPSERIQADPVGFALNPQYIDPGAPRFELVGRVSRVIDGDSIEVQVRGNKFAVRLFGIDTPEHDQPHGENASRALTRKLEGREVAVSIEDIDDYGRLVGTVYQKGHNTNLEMVADGHAWWYQQYARSQRDLERAQHSARDAGLGLWGEADPVAPWEWRRSH